MVSEHQSQIHVKRGLKRKLILSMLLVGALPLGIGLTMAFFQGTKEIREVSGASFETLATETARKIDLILSEELAQNSLIATEMTIIKALEGRRDVLAEYREGALNALIAQEAQDWKTKDTAFVQSLTHNDLVTVLRGYYGGSYVDPGHPIPVVTRSATRGLFITDVAGRLMATLNTNVPYAHAQESWWKGAFKNGAGQPHIENVSFNTQLDVHTFTLSLPIMDSLRYQVVGVLHRIYDAKEFFASHIDTIGFGETGHVMLIDGNGTVLSCPVLSTGTHLEDSQIIPLVTPMQIGWTAAPSDGHGGVRSSIIGFAPLPTTSQITHASTGKGWHIFVWQSSDELFAPIDHLFMWVSVFGLLSIGLLVTLGSFAAARIVTPIRRLQETAKLIGQGEWQEPINIKTGDEIEALADEVNRMNAQLASAFAGLESEVETKSQEVKYLQESTGQILDSIPDPVIMINQDQHIQYLNRASKEVFHLETNGECVGQPLFAILDIDSTTQQQLGQEFQALLASSTEAPVERALATNHDSGVFRDPLQQATDGISGMDLQEIYFYGKTYGYQWFRLRARPGHKPEIGLVFRDVTEESRLQDRLIKEEKLASLGVLSSGIGHELNNPLVGVIGLGEAIQDEEKLSQINEYAQSIVQHGRRMASIIKDFTGQATSQVDGAPTSVNIKELLEDSLAVVKKSYDMASLDIQEDYQGLSDVLGNSHEFRQAFVHILTNAVQAMGGEGILKISTSVDTQEIQIKIQDNGEGIPHRLLPKIFDPFFTTKQQGDGAGLGLTIARRIIQKYAGQIQVKSKEGEGTTCQLRLPLYQKNSSDVKEDILCDVVTKY